MASKTQPDVVISGLLIPINWAVDGKITRLGIAALNEKDYILELPFELESYMSHLRKEVEAHGVITREMRGKKVLKVKELRIIGS